MSSTPGVPGINPLDYTGLKTNVIPIRSFPRRPVSTDTKYRVGQVAILSTNPSTGSVGELWYLANFSAGAANWVQLSGTGTGIEGFVVSTGTSPVVANASNQITLADGNGTAWTGGTSTLTVDMSTPFTGAFEFTGAFTLSNYTQNALPYFGASGLITNLGPLTNAQFIMGKTSSPPQPMSFVEGTGISIVSDVSTSPGTVTISTTGSGFTWTDDSGAIAVTSNSGYFITATATATLPASPTNGDSVAFILETTDALTITASGTQVIRIGNVVSGGGGTCVSTAHGDALALVYRATNESWIADSGPTGTWTIT